MGTHAHTHSNDHRVYIKLETEKFYCRPEGYEVIDPSLDDIRHVLNPRFAREQVRQLDTNRQWSRALNGSYYLPGMVGLSNIKDAPDFVNVTIQSLMRVNPLRNSFLFLTTTKTVNPNLWIVLESSHQRFGTQGTSKDRGREREPEQADCREESNHGDEQSAFLDASLCNILNNKSFAEVVRPRLARMRYRVTKLPQYLILHMHHFTKNNFVV
ncbi:hypothetical protein BUALT_Bualt02G0141800 [Buddleja alternifolia]|uniref:UBP-type domain-containing protein n=1 Tax=Buddleja alternifolia TaxID=168488 RepID=A0AAV6Y768_9LAMI|nr:hypothetical protein BUALT_Bualt02G0141800 [Buddleja alternifolia]